MRCSTRWVSVGAMTATLIMVSVSPLLSVDVDQVRHWGNFARKASWLYKKGQYQEAVEPAENALRLAEKIFTEEEDQERLATSLFRLGSIYRKLGRYAEAEPLYKRCVTIREELWGRDSLDVARVLNPLAHNYYEQGQYDEAEPLYKRVLAVREKTLTPDNPKVTRSLNRLANVYKFQGEYAKAEPLYKRALGILEKTGVDHQKIVKTLLGLAEVYTMMGKEDEAKKLLDRAARIRASQ